MNSSIKRTIRSLAVFILLSGFATGIAESAQILDLYLLTEPDYSTIITHLKDNQRLIYYDGDIALLRSPSPLTAEMSAGVAPPILLDSAPAGTSYILVADPLGLGEEKLSDFGRIIPDFPRDKGYLLATISEDCTWINAGGYLAFPLRPRSTIHKTSAVSEQPEYNALIPLALNNYGTAEGYKLIDKFEDYGTRFTYSDQLISACDYIYNLLADMGYSVEIHEYDFDLINWSQYHEIDFTPNYTLGYLVCRDGFLFATADYGDTFERIPLITAPYAICALDEEHIWLAGGGGKVALSSDGGGNWEVTQTPTEATFFSVDFYDQDVGIACGTDGAIVYTQDGGVSWQLGASESVKDLMCIHMLSSDTALCGGFEGTLLKTTDGGATWSDICPPELAGHNIRDLCFISDTEGWMAEGAHMMGGKIAHTTDGGENWTVQDEDEYNLLAVSFSDGLNGWAGGVGDMVKHTTDGGASWEELSLPNEDRYVTDLYALSADRLLVCCIYGPHYITTDGGTTWQEMNLGEGGLFSRPNIVATRYGELYPDEEVVLVAHYDSISYDPWIAAPGADDNASGTASVLLAARAMTNFNFARTVRFLLVSGEEQGLRGSWAYAEDAYTLGRNIVAVVNADMLGFRDDQLYDVGIREGEPWEWMGEYMVTVAEYYLPELEVIPHFVGWGGSDHMSFQAFGYPALMVGEYPGSFWYPYIHTPYDTLDKLDPLMVSLGAKLQLAGAMSFADPLSIVPQPQTSPEPYPAPNPFRPGGDAPGVSFVNLEGYTTLAIYDISGTRVYSYQLGGEVSHLWTATNNSGDAVASGVYLWVLESDSKPPTSGKIAVIR